MMNSTFVVFVFSFLGQMPQDYARIATNTTGVHTGNIWIEGVQPTGNQAVSFEWDGVGSGTYIQQPNGSNQIAGISTCDVDIDDNTWSSTSKPNYAIAWGASSTSGGVPNIYVSVNGGSPTFVAEASFARVAISRSGGKIAVVYLTPESSDGSNQVLAQYCQADFTNNTVSLVGSSFTVNNIITGAYYVSADVSMDDASTPNVYYSYVREDSPSSSSTGVFIRGWTYNNTSVLFNETSTTLFNTTTSDYNRTEIGAINGGNGFVVAWSGNSPSKTSAYAAWAQWYSISGSSKFNALAMSNVINVNNYPMLFDSYPRVGLGVNRTLQSGSPLYAVSYVTPTSNGDIQYPTYVTAASGSTVSYNTVANSPIPQMPVYPFYSQLYPSTAVGSSTWVDYQINTTYNGVYYGVEQSVTAAP